MFLIAATLYAFICLQNINSINKIIIQIPNMRNEVEALITKYLYIIIPH